MSFGRAFRWNSQFAMAGMAAALAVAGCNASSQGAPAGVAAPQETSDIYLPPGETGGGKLCFDPESRRLRALLNARPRASDPIDPIALYRDLPFLREVMRLQYVGYAEMVQRTDFDLSSFFQHWKKDLAGAGVTTSFDRAVLGPLRTLRAVFPDNHHTVFGPSITREPAFAAYEYQAVVASADAVGPLASCRIEGAGTAVPSTLRVARLLGPEGARSVLTVSVRGGGERVSAHCARGASFELARRPESPPRPAPTPSEKLYSWRTIGETVLITVRRLSGTGAQEAQLKELAGDYDQHRRFSRIIFDFRGNGGGNDGYIADWIDKAKKGIWDGGADRELLGALTPCQTWNTLVQRQIRDGSVDTADARADREHVRAQWPPGPHHPTWVYRSGLVEGHAERPYAGRIYVLVDRDSGSSGESGPFMLRQALGATLVGERTAGIIEFGNQRSFVLPRSGVVWNLPAKRNFFEQPVESVGFPVDIYLVDPEAPVEQIAAMLDTLPAPAAR